MRHWITVQMMALALLALAAPSTSANHRWSKYHWARTSTAAPVALTVDQGGVGGSWVTSNDAVLNDWNGYSGGVLSLRSGTTGVDVTVASGDFGATGWLGLAQVRVDTRRHIVEGRVSLNDHYYGAGSPYVGTERAVYCQEIGHTFGLSHNRDGRAGGLPDDTCMNDRHFYASPNVHDTEMLVQIYDHADGYSTSSTRRRPASGWIRIHSVPALTGW